MREILPSLDNFDHTLKLQCSTEDAKCILDGVELIKREIFRALEKRGVKRIETEGKMFDANFHEAVGMCQNDDCKENEIVEEILPGYMLYDRLIRAAKVKIAKPQPEQEPKEGKPEE